MQFRKTHRQYLYLPFSCPKNPALCYGLHCTILRVMHLSIVPHFNRSSGPLLLPSGPLTAPTITAAGRSYGIRTVSAFSNKETKTMGVEIQQAIALPGQTVILNFNNPLQAWVVGMNMFSLTYGPNTDHWVETISISLQTNQPTTSMIGNQLGVTVHAQLQDASGHTIYVDGSSGSQIGVTCVAITGSNDPQTYMGNVTGIANNTSVPVELPGSGGSFTALTSCLSGFNLSFNTTDHHFAG